MEPANAPALFDPARKETQCLRPLAMCRHDPKLHAQEASRQDITRASNLVEPLGVVAPRVSSSTLSMFQYRKHAVTFAPSCTDMASCPYCDPRPQPSPLQAGLARLMHSNAKPGQARVSWGGEQTGSAA
jgi:hypothetical protein